MRKPTLAALIPVLFLLHQAFSYGDPAIEEDLLGFYGDEDILSIATGRKQSVRKAPAVASVITRDDIKSIGARDLNEILETIPGLHVSFSPVGNNPIYVIRGIYSEFNSQVLVLIDGIPITNAFIGNRGQAWGGMPVEDILRVEVLRGPGSSLYGADAYSGVINIITSTNNAKTIGTEMGIRFGNKNDKNAWLTHQTNINDWRISSYIEILETDNNTSTIDADAQSGFDTSFGTTATLAPGPINTGSKALDIRLALQHENLSFNLAYQGRRDIGTGGGAAEALDPKGSSESDRILVSGTYTNSDLIENWDITAKASYYDISNKSDLVLFPPGSDFTALGGGAFPNGVIGNPDVHERHSRFDISGFYTGIDNHDILVGAGIHHEDMHDIRETKNFTLSAFAAPIPIGNVIDVTNTAPFIEPHDRTVVFAFIQDEWKLAADWSLTAGLRYDHYSDVGSTVNPRAALVWETGYSLTSKLLYGRAFRAPAFAEQFNINNPVALGNPDLDPETIDTIEVAFDYRHNDKFQSNLNLFYYQMEDIIRFVDDPAPASSKTAQNVGKQDGHGFEYEFKWQLLPQLKLLGNFAYQASEDDATGKDPGFSPGRQAYLRANWRAGRGINIIPQLNYVADRDRSFGDTRDAVDDYTLVDLTVRWQPVSFKGLELAASVRNLFDENAAEPSPASDFIFIPGDLPLSDRSFFAELRYQFSE